LRAVAGFFQACRNDADDAGVLFREAAQTSGLSVALEFHLL
jgi:hypothetical protein